MPGQLGGGAGALISGGRPKRAAVGEAADEAAAVTMDETAKIKIESTAGRSIAIGPGQSALGRTYEEWLEIAKKRDLSPDRRPLYRQTTRPSADAPSARRNDRTRRRSPSGHVLTPSRPSQKRDRFLDAVERAAVEIHRYAAPDRLQSTGCTREYL